MKRRLIFGAAVQARHILVDYGFREAIISNCETVTPELELKWNFVEDEPGQFYLRPAEQIADFARTNGKRMHGHALVWHKGIPPWAAQQLITQHNWAPVRTYFEQVIPLFNDVTDSWDVINEPIKIGDRDDGLRPSPYLQAFGSEYIARSFSEAAELAPSADLFLNEYGLVYNYPDSIAKRVALLGLLEVLVSNGVPIAGVGIQGHLKVAEMDKFDQRTFANFLRDISDFGLKIRISELDVAEARTDIPVAQRDATVGQVVRNFLEVAIDNPALVAISCWGLTDRYSWLPPYSESAGLNRGLPLNNDLERKPMHQALQWALGRTLE